VIDDLGWIDAVGQAELVRSKEVSPLELVDAAIARIERLDPYLNAVIHRMYDKARAAAESGALPDGPFRGVPFLMKDAVAHTAGDPFHCGMAFLKAREHTEEVDSYFAAKLRAAFLFVGKTNLRSCGVLPHRAGRYGPTHNRGTWLGPRRLERWQRGCGRLGMVPAHANDMGARSGCLQRLWPRRAEAGLPHVARPDVRRVLGDAHPRARRDADRA
jgi:amidase